MAHRENLLTIIAITDDETRTCKIGEINFGVHGSLRTYLEEYGLEGMKNVLALLGHLAWEVKEEYYSIQKKKEAKKIK